MGRSLQVPIFKSGDQEIGLDATWDLSELPQGLGPIAIKVIQRQTAEVNL